MAKKKQEEPAEPIIIDEDDFFTEYKPLINHIVRTETADNIADEEICSYNGCLYETYGKEVAHIINLANHPKTRNKVWTIVDAEDDTQVILAGFHLVNRFGYFVTEKPWITGSEEVRIDNSIDE